MYLSEHPTPHWRAKVQLINIVPESVAFERLSAAGIVRGTAHQYMLARRCAPRELPAHPSERFCARFELSRHPRPASIIAEIHAANEAVSGPGEAMNRV